MSDMSLQRFAIFHQMLLFQGYTRCLLTLLTPVINILIIIKKRVAGLLPPPVFVRTKIIKSVQTLEEEKYFLEEEFLFLAEAFVE